MPIYAFECAECGHSFDRLQKIADPDPAACPACGADAIRRQVTAPSFRLAGSGWYETDFKKDGDRKRNLAGSEGGEGAKAGEAGATAGGPAADSKATGDKPATKPAGKPADAPKPAATTKPAA